MEKFKYLLNIQFFAEDGAPEGEKAPEPKKAEETKKDESKTFTQAEVDEIIKKRLSRDKKEEPKEEPLVTADTKATDEARRLMEMANKKLLQVTAQAEALKLDIAPQYIQDVVALAKLDAIKVDKNGEYDAGEISKSISEVLERLPIFKNQKQEGSTGFKIGGEGTNSNNKPSSWSTKDQPMKPWNKFQK